MISLFFDFCEVVFANSFTTTLVLLGVPMAVGLLTAVYSKSTLE